MGTAYCLCVIGRCINTHSYHFGELCFHKTVQEGLLSYRQTAVKFSDESKKAIVKVNRIKAQKSSVPKTRSSSTRPTSKVENRNQDGELKTNLLDNYI